MNAIVQLALELAYYDIAVRHVSHLAILNPSENF